MSVLLGCSNIYPPALTDPPTYLHRLKLFLPPHLIACFASHAAVERAVAHPRSGILSFASTTFILSMFNVNARGITIPNVVVGMAIFSGGLVQFVAGMWEYPRGNVFGATGACLFFLSLLSRGCCACTSRQSAARPRRGTQGHAPVYTER